MITKITWFEKINIIFVDYIYLYSSLHIISEQ